MMRLDLDKLRYLLRLAGGTLSDRAVLLRISLPLLMWVAATELLLDGPLPPDQVPTTLGAVYQGLRYFTLDPHWVPGHDTPLAWTVFGWFVALGAPAITAGALIEGVLKLAGVFERPLARVSFLDGHVIIAGFGDHGREVARVLTARGVDCAAVNLVAVAEGTVEVAGGSVPVLAGDLSDPEVLQQAGLARARAIVFTTGDPLVNLNGALVARELLEGELAKELAAVRQQRARRWWRTLARLGPGSATLDEDKAWPHIVTLVDDRGAEGTVLDELVDGNARPITRFDQFEAAALTLVDRVSVHIDRCVERGQLRVAILGFGRFGSAIATRLLEAWPGDAGVELELVVVDLQARRRACELPRGGAWTVRALVEDVEEWVGRVVEDCGCEPGESKGYPAPDFAFLCTSEDGTNLRCASRLRRHVGTVEVALRMINPPSGLDRGDQGVLACNVIEAFGHRFETEVVDGLLQVGPAPPR